MIESTHEFTSIDGAAVTLRFKRSLLSEAKFLSWHGRFAADREDATIGNFCFMAAHVVEAENAPGLPMQVNVADDVFWSVYEAFLALFDSFEGFGKAIDAIPAAVLPEETDPVKKHDKKLSKQEAADPN